jgi:thioredoxin-related protein
MESEGNFVPSVRNAAPKKEAVLMSETESVNRSQIITALSVFGLAFFLILLFLSQKSAWNKQLKTAQEEVNEIRNASQSRLSEDSLRAKYFKTLFFDPHDEKNFRVYGLFKDREGKYSKDEIAQKFNIGQARSIEMNEVKGEKWFVVPVKTVHFVQKGETAEIIGSMYYRNKKSARLLEEFNGKIEAGKAIFVPFD